MSTRTPGYSMVVIRQFYCYDINQKSDCGGGGGGGGSYDIRIDIRSLLI